MIEKGKPTHSPIARRARQIPDEKELLETVSGGDETDLEAQKQQQQAAQTRFTYVATGNCLHDWNFLIFSFRTILGRQLFSKISIKNP